MKINLARALVTVVCGALMALAASLPIWPSLSDPSPDVAVLTERPSIRIVTPQDTVVEETALAPQGQQQDSASQQPLAGLSEIRNKTTISPSATTVLG